MLSEDHIRSSTRSKLQHKGEWWKGLGSSKAGAGGLQEPVTAANWSCRSCHWRTGSLRAGAGYRTDILCNTILLCGQQIQWNSLLYLLGAPQAASTTSLTLLDLHVATWFGEGNLGVVNRSRGLCRRTNTSRFRCFPNFFLLSFLSCPGDLQASPVAGA